MHEAKQNNKVLCHSSLTLVCWRRSLPAIHFLRRHRIHVAGEHWQQHQRQPRVEHSSDPHYALTSKDSHRHNIRCLLPCTYKNIEKFLTIYISRQICKDITDLNWLLHNSTLLYLLVQQVFFKIVENRTFVLILLLYQLSTLVLLPPMLVTSNSKQYKLLLRSVFNNTRKHGASLLN